MLNLTERYQKKFGIKTKLRGYQLKAVNRAIELRDGFALLMDPRLGKTRVTVAVAGYLFLNDGIELWVKICPIIAMEVWRQEIEDTLNIPYEIHILKAKGSKREGFLKAIKPVPGKLSIILMNFEALPRLRKLLYRKSPELVTVDESQKIKNHSSKQSKFIHTLGGKANFRGILTGTFMAKPEDAFSQYKFIHPETFGTLWKKGRNPKGPLGFLNHYTDTWGFGGHNPETYKNLDKLQEKIKSRAFILTRAEAGGFPQEQTQDFKFELTSPASRHYSEMEEELRTMVQGRRVSAEIILTQILRLQQITGGFLPVREPDEDQQTNVALGSDRIDALSGLLEEYDKGFPFVIFAKYRYEVESILARLKKMGRSSTFILGGDKGRDQAIRDFRDGKVDNCVSQIRAGGVSVDLSRSNTAIFYSTSDFMAYEQARARVIARTGGTVSFLRLMAIETIDEDILDSLRDNSNLVKKILGKPIYKA